MKLHLLYLLIIFCLVNYSYAAKPLNYEIISTANHNPLIFTQGFTLEDGWLFESSGLYGKSFVSIYHATSGAPRARANLPPQQFAEGLTLANNNLYVLTWRAGVLHVFDAKKLKAIKTISYTGEGWGLCHDDKQFIMSNGSNQLFFRDNDTFEIKRKIKVTDNKKPIRFLNELEYAQNAIWANIWQTDNIIRINPATGAVTGVLNLHKLVELNQQHKSENVLNGIAYDKEKNAFWVTGKFWPKRYLIKILDN